MEEEKKEEGLQEGEVGESNNPSSEKFRSKLLLTNEEIRARGIRECDIELYRRKCYQFSFGIESWYEALSDHTFKTVLTDLTKEEATAIYNIHHAKPDAVKEEDTQRVKVLEERIDKLLEQFPHGAYVKLNTRSPKDVPIYDFDNEVLKKLIIEELDKIDTKERDCNKEANAFVVATNRYMKVSRGADAIDLLLRSDRVSEDISKALSFEDLFDVKLVIREWLNEVAGRPQYEFRAFVHENKLNAMSQYFSFCKYDDLIQRKKEVEQLILNFFDQVKTKISHESYVIDFYVREDNEVMIIELNPFHNGAGACLFSWREDREKFLHGPFEFRVTEELKGDPLRDLLAPRWIRFVDDHRDPPKEEEEEKEGKTGQTDSGRCNIC